MLVALTGGIGCGKSTVLDIFCKNGWRTLDADDVAHLVLENYEFVYSNIIPYFGKSVVTVDGIVDRKKLADIVFSDLVKLHYLEDKMHPYIFDYIADWKRNIREKNQNGIVAIPLLFEKKFDQNWDYILCVASDAPTMKSRLFARGWSEEHMKQRLDSQMPLLEKMNKSNLIIYNNGTIRDLEKNVDCVIRMMGSKIE